MQTEEKPMRVINHKTMRKIIGLIAILMPIVVVFLSGRPEPELSSISISYWTDSRDIFVGSLIAVAFFLVAYNGTGTCRRDTEFWLSKAACVSAIFVALFPTTCTFDKCMDAPNWIMYISELFFLEPQEIHYTTAIFLFIFLILLISFFSLRAKNKGEFSRSRIYFGLSLGMLFGMPIIYGIGELSGWYEPVFWVEFVGLWLFGAGWFVAGAYTTKPEKPVPEDATILKELEVDPRNLHFPTDIDVEAGAQYFFQAKGCWKDWFLECGPNGWGPDWNPFAAKNRVRWKPLFLLCGNVGKKDDRTFCIGDRYTWTVPSEVNDLDPEDRKLYLFANDWETRYGNNEALEPKEGGPLKVTIYRLKSNEE
jgi:hypothetical protein